MLLFYNSVINIKYCIDLFALYCKIKDPLRVNKKLSRAGYPELFYKRPPLKKLKKLWPHSTILLKPPIKTCSYQICTSVGDTVEQRYFCTITLLHKRIKLTKINLHKQTILHGLNFLFILQFIYFNFFFKIKVFLFFLLYYYCYP